MADSDTVQVQVTQISATASEGSARDHAITMDRPPVKGGENKGPMGGEVLLMALGGCFMSNLLAAIDARDADVSDITLTISGHLAQSPGRFDAIRIEIDADYPERAIIEKMVIIAERSCIVANTLKRCIDLTFSIV